MPTVSTLVSPYGGSLVNLIPNVDEREELRGRVVALRSTQISDRSVWIRIIGRGFSPVDRSMSKAIGPFSAVCDLRTAACSNPNILPIEAAVKPQLMRKSSGDSRTFPGAARKRCSLDFDECAMQFSNP
jgi:hypothetical protein